MLALKFEGYKNKSEYRNGYFIVKLQIIFSQRWRGEDDCQNVINVWY